MCREGQLLFLFFSAVAEKSTYCLFIKIVIKNRAVGGCDFLNFSYKYLSERKMVLSKKLFNVWLTLTRSDGAHYFFQIFLFNAQKNHLLLVHLIIYRICSIVTEQQEATLFDVERHQNKAYSPTLLSSHRFRRIVWKSQGAF